MIKLFVPILLCLLSYQMMALDKLNRALYKHASKADTSLIHDPDALVAYLIQPALDKKQQAEVIAYWIAQNISYNFSVLQNHQFHRDNWAKALLERKALCYGFSELFRELCRRAGIKCYSISGYAKGFGYTSGQFQGVNHTWNVANISGQYYLFDVTWASSLVYNEGANSYTRKIEVKHLFADPEKFALQHFPTSRGGNFWIILWIWKTS